MEIAPDFFDYFEATATLLDNDKYALVNLCCYKLNFTVTRPLALESHPISNY